jgi:hypothetical protein
MKLWPIPHQGNDTQPASVSERVPHYWPVLIDEPFRAMMQLSASLHALTPTIPVISSDLILIELFVLELL